MSESVLLQATGVAVHFGGVHALDGIDFTLRERELRCLIGPNGAGKTTFFRCLTGGQRPTKGRILFRGREIAGAQRFQIARAGIGIKTQVPNLFEGLTAHENVWIALRETDGIKARNTATLQALETVGIAHLARGIVGRMAHGQRQLVELAMVIARDPDLVLLDEPAAGMTGAEVEQLAAIIRQINIRHAVVVVEHDMQFIRMIGEAVTVFHQGRILIEGKVEDILSDATVREIYLGKSHAH
jgi:ABC-type uncharacterized transport system ATPase subunit